MVKNCDRGLENAFRRVFYVTSGSSSISSPSSPHTPQTHSRFTVEEINRSDEGLTIETLAFLPFTVANLRFQLSC